METNDQGGASRQLEGHVTSNDPTSSHVQFSRNVRRRTSHGRGEAYGVNARIGNHMLPMTRAMTPGRGSGHTPMVQQTQAQTPFFPGIDLASFMRTFQAGHMTSFPSTSIPVSLGNLPAQAYTTLPLAVDSIQSRRFGNNPQYDQRAKAALARPPPNAPIRANKRPAKLCKICIWIPCRMSAPMPYKGGNYDLMMKKILQFRVLPIEIWLPGDTQWGGVYNGEAFIPGSGQSRIAQQCSEALDSKKRSNPEWASMAGCFFTKTPKGQHRHEAKYMGGASMEPLYYPSCTRWNLLPKKNIVYIPNPSTQMTAEQIRMYKESAAIFETPVGMDALEDGAICETAVNSLEDDESSAHGDGEESARESESDLNDRENSYQPNIYNNPQRNDEDNENRISEDNSLGFSYPTAEHNPDASIGIGTQTEVASQEFNIAHRTRASQASALIGAIGDHHHELRSHASSSFVHEINSDEEDFLRLPRRLRRVQQNISAHPGGIEYTNDHALFEYTNRQSALITEEENSVKMHTELFESWLAASQEVEELIAKYSEKLAKPESSSGQRGTLIVDLGDLATAFWECFEASCLENSDLAEEVAEDLNILITRRSQRMGLTKNMLEISVPRILYHVESLKPYNKNNMEMYFNKAAMPNWHLWEELMAVLDVSSLNMDFVEENEDWLQKMIEQAPETLSKEQFTESRLISLRKEFLEWKALDAKLANSRLAKTEEEYDILKAKKKEQHALHQLTVFDISYTKLGEFRRFHEAATKNFIEVIQGGELTAIRELCKGVIDRKVIFGDFFVKYTTVTNSYSIRESTTIDAGGLTDRLLTQAWSTLFNSSGEFHSVFDKGDTINHLSSNVPDTPHVQNDIILVGQLMFLLILKKQRVTAEMTMATIAMAMGKEPDRASIRLALETCEDNIYIKDYKEFRPRDYALMEVLMKGGLGAARVALDLINTNMVEDCLKFGRLRIDLGEIRFQTDVRAIMVEIIYNTLFVRCSPTAKYLREGFFSLVNTVLTSPTISQADKKEVITKTLAGVEVSAMSTFFSAEQAVTGDEFLSRVDYENGFPEKLKSIFVEVVKRFTSPEAYKLYAFITDEKFNRGTRCHIKHSRVLSLDCLPRASTCSKTLELPHYQNVNIMIQKLSLATHSLDYGHA